MINVGEDHARTALLGDRDDAQQDRNADAVDQLGVAEIDYERTTTRIKPVLTLALDSFPSQFV